MNKERGFIQIIVILVLVIVVVSLLGISVKGIFDKLAENKVLGDNFNYVWSGVKSFFNAYLYDYAVKVWDFIWNALKAPFSHFLNKAINPTSQ